ncbi:MAG: MnmC family methyltransferase [Verrucomicrobiota bacterium]
MASQSQEQYRLVRLANGAYSVHSLAHAETFHPVIGPVQEGEILYVRQLHLPDRLRGTAGEFVVWDVGLGAAANALTVLRAMRPVAGRVRLISFDHTTAPLEFARTHSLELGYFDGYESPVEHLLKHGTAGFSNGMNAVQWQLILGDFPTWLERELRTRATPTVPPPQAILFDAFSPATNPAMWTLPLFRNLFRLLQPNVPCSLATYSRSTLLRVSLLLGGFFVGSGHATGEKEETTIAANTLALLETPLDRKWLMRARRSTSAEPLMEPVYRQARLTPETWDQLQAHPQFQSS